MGGNGNNKDSELAISGFREDALFLDSIVENIPDMIFVKEASELRFVRFNRSGEELLGIPREEMIGKNDHDFFPHEEADFFTQKDREVLRQTGVIDIPEEPIHTRSRGKRWLHTKKIPIRDAEGNPIYLLGISEDITEIREARRALAERTEQLAKANEELADSNRQLQDFVYIASHDLQEPLRGIVGYLELLRLRSGEALDPEGLGFLERSIASAQRMSELIQALLHYSRVARAELRWSEVDMSRVLTWTQHDLLVSLAESGAELVAVSALPRVRADLQQMGQLLQNLVANAIKFRRSGTLPRIEVSGSVVDGKARFCIRDNGIGIEPDYFGRIFRAFQRLHSARAYPGSGMGLAICQRIVERHGGELWVESTPGAGSAFWFTLPLAEGE